MHPSFRLGWVQSTGRYGPEGRIGLEKEGYVYLPASGRDGDRVELSLPRGATERGKSKIQGGIWAGWLHQGAYLLLHGQAIHGEDLHSAPGDPGSVNKAAIKPNLKFVDSENDLAGS